MADAAHLKPAAVLNALGGRFSPKAFLQGLIGGIALLALYAAWLWSQSGAIQHAREARLAAVTTTVDMSALSPNGIKLETLPPDVPEAAIHADDLTPAVAATDHAAAETHEAETHAAPVTPVVPPAAAITLTPAPVEGLYETTADGKLPIVDKRSGHTAFQTYRRPFEAASAKGKSLIALVVTDAGLSQAATDTALADLPPPVSIALSPYATTPDAMVGAVRAKGHEVWMVLPMQSPAYPRVDPGPHTMLAGAPSSENLKKLTALMARASGYVGFIGTRDADFTASDNDFHPVANAIYGRGLGFIDPSGKAPADMTHHTAKADVWFERSASKSDIDAALKRLEDAARVNGHAIGVLPPMPLIYPAVRDWIAGLQQKGFAIAPLSAIADMNVVAPSAQAAAIADDLPKEVPTPPPGENAAEHEVPASHSSPAAAEEKPAH